MLIEITDVLDRDGLRTVNGLLAGEPFVDGRRSAGPSAATVKRNEELDPRSPRVGQLNEIVVASLYRHPEFQRAVLPHRVSGASFVRYRPGMAYGDHTDDAVMGAGPSYRSDVAVTVFLTDTASYDGGELVIRTGLGEREIKLPAGSAVVYPASTRHRVNEVRSGERVVAVAWAQSLVRDPARRELLYELDRARQSVKTAGLGDDVGLELDNVYGNLVRMWAEL